MIRNRSVDYIEVSYEFEINRFKNTKKILNACILVNLHRFIVCLENTNVEKLLL